MREGADELTNSRDLPMQTRDACSQAAWILIAMREIVPSFRPSGTHLIATSAAETLVARLAVGLHHCVGSCAT